MRSTRFPSGYRGMFRNDAGHQLTPQEARDTLRLELAKGHNVIPISKDCGPAPCAHAGEGCTGFDYSGGGCPGYCIDEEASAEKLPEVGAQ